MTDESLFAAALQLPAAERAAFLNAHCPDAAVRKQVEELIAAADASNPLDRRPLDVEQTIHRTQAPPEPSASVGDRVGPYKLLEKIGEGGMGEVWVADQLEPIKRRVALKLIKPGMDSRSVLGRFEAERQALAVMDHPNIAKVLDAGYWSPSPLGGEGSGVRGNCPYFVMELVKGTPITEFADARKLTTQQRLELFVPVCQAIQHAHMKGIIHRDIKPSNVLVALHDETPVPKVIDFGVAKAVGQQLTEKTIYTGFGALVGTPAYMAPEQATFNQLDVDTRADVYALGVLLYELLAGSPPIERERLKKAALDEVLRIVREEEPPRPSQRLSTADTRASIAAVRGTEPAKLSQLMRGELDWIVMKALEKDRTRRYETANGFAADVQRYLSGEQVQAVPPSVGYRVRKWWRKNRTAGMVASTFALLLTVGIAVATVLAVRAAAAEQVAKENADRANENAASANQAQEQALADRNAAVAAREQQQAEQYLADMQLMPSVFEKGNGTDVHAILARHLPKPDATDRRNFEWHYWNRQVNSEDRSLQLEGATFPSTAQWTTSEDGTRVACFALPNSSVPNSPPVPTLTVWAVPSGRKLLTHTFSDRPEKSEPGGFGGLVPVAPKFSPDGTRIAAGYGISKGTAGDRTSPVPIVVESPGPVVAVDVNTGKVLLETTLPEYSSNTAFSFNRDGTRLQLTGIGRGATNPLSLVYDLTKPASEPLRTQSGTLRTNSEEKWRLVHPDGKSVVVGRVLPPGSVLPVDALAGVAASADVTGVVEIRDLKTDAVKHWWPARTTIHNSPVLTADGTRMAAWTPAWYGGTQPNVTRTGTEPNERPVERLKIWETVTGKELGGWERSQPRPGETQGSLTFSPDGSRLVVEPHRSLFQGPRVSQIVVLSGTTAGLFSEPTDVPTESTSAQVLSRDGSRLLKAWYNTLYVWNTTSGELLRTVRTGGAAFRAFGTFDGGKRFWAVDSTGRLREWPARPPDPLTVPYTAAGRFRLPSLSPDGTRYGLLVSSDDDLSRGLRLEIADTAGKRLHSLTPPNESASWQERGPVPSFLTAFSRGAERACMVYRPSPPPGGNPVTDERNFSKPRGGPELTVWDTAIGKVLRHQLIDGVGAFGDERPSLVAGEAYRMDFAPDGKTVALANWPKTKEGANGLRLFDVDTDRERPQLDVPAGTRVVGLTFSPTADRIAAVVLKYDSTERPPTTTATLLIWDAATGKPLVSEQIGGGERVAFNATPIAVLAWSPKADRIAVSFSGTAVDLITLRDARTGKETATPDLPSGRFGIRSLEPSFLAFHPDGTRLAILLRAGGLVRDAEIRLLDVESGKAVLTLPITEPESRSPGERPLRRITFSADGRRLLIFSDTALALAGRGLRDHEFRVTTYDTSPPPEPKK